LGNTIPVKVALTAEDQGVSAAIRQLGQELKNLKKNEQEASEGAISLSKAFQGIVAVAGLLKLAEIGKEAFDAAVDIGKMADKTGQSTEQLSVFHHVAEELGVSTEGVDKALVKAARSITEFEQGSSKAAKGFALLNIHQKDFSNLKPDQKIALVTERLGSMRAGLDKAQAAQLIFSRAGADFIPVANAIAGEGFDKVTESARKLGLLLSQDTTDAFRAAKASMQELSDVGKGAATQFEAGLLPAVADVAEGIVEAITSTDKGVESFKHLGEIAGTALRFIAFSLASVGIEAGHAFAEVEEAADFAFNHSVEAAKSAFAAIKGYIRSGIGGAAADAATQIATSGDKGTQDFATRFAAIATDNEKAQQALYDKMFPSDEEEAKRNKERIARLRPDKTTQPGGIPDDSKARDAARDDLRHQAELDRIAKAEEALLVRQLQDEISIWKAYEKQRETVEKNSYEDGQLTTEEFYRRRQADLKTETEKELQILRAELKATEDEITRAAEQRDSNTAKAGQFRGRAQHEGPTTTGGKEATGIARDYEGEASKNEASRLAALARFNELQTEINTTTIDGQTKSIALDTEKNKEQDADRKKVLEFEAQLAELQGKRVEKSLAEIEAQATEKREALQKAGVPTDQIDVEIAKWKQLTLAAAEFAKVEDEVQQKEKTFEIERNSFDIARNTIEAQQKTGQLTKSAAEKKINDLIAARLPLLKQEAAAELAIAQAALRQAQSTGNQNDIAKAQEQVAAAQNLEAEVTKLGIKTNQLATSVKGALSQDFQSFFNTLMSGTTSAGRAFAQLGISVVQSLEKIAAQLLINFALQKLTDALGLTSGGSKIAKTITTNDAIISSNAGAAGAAAFASVMEDLPFPANIAAAPGVMAAAIAAVLSNLALGSASQGAFLNKDMLVQAHAEEMVLPPHLSTGLDYAIRTGSFNPPEALSQPITSSRGGDTYGGDTYNLHHNGEDAKKVLERELVPMIKTARRQGKIRL
jgi:hypothetical protein